MKALAPIIISLALTAFAVILSVAVTTAVRRGALRIDVGPIELGTETPS